MTDGEIISLVNDSLIEEFELEESVMVPEAEIFADLGLDSLDIVDMVVVLEGASILKFGMTPACVKSGHWAIFTVLSLPKEGRQQPGESVHFHDEPLGLPAAVSLDSYRSSDFTPGFSDLA